jgi:hypothetical protein
MFPAAACALIVLSLPTARETSGDAVPLRLFGNPEGLVRSGTIEGQFLEVRDGEIVLRNLHFSINSLRGPIEYIGTGEDKPCKIRLSGDLAKGIRPIPRVTDNVGRDEGFLYKIGELERGDIVRVKIDVVSGTEICDCIRIERRPGGIIPQATLYPRARFTPPNVRFQAYQDYEEKGIPLPEQFGGLRMQKQLDTRLATVRSILATAEKIEKEKKAKELKADPKAEKK